MQWSKIKQLKRNWDSPQMLEIKRVLLALFFQKYISTVHIKNDNEIIEKETKKLPFS